MYWKWKDHQRPSCIAPTHGSMDAIRLRRAYILKPASASFVSLLFTLIGEELGFRLRRQ